MNRDRLARRLVLIAASILPRWSRKRYLEEWQADLEHAGELNIRRREIVLGAFALCVTANRFEPDLEPNLLSNLAIRRARWALALIFCSPVIVIGAQSDLVAIPLGYEPIESAYPHLMRALFFVAQLWAGVGVLAALAGFGMLWLSARNCGRIARIGVTLTIVAAVLCVTYFAPFIGVLPSSWTSAVGIFTGPAALLGVLLFPAGASLAFAGIFATPRHPKRVATPAADAVKSSSSVVVAIATVALLVLGSLVALGLFDGLYWSPQLIYPTMTIDQIYGAVSASDRAFGIGMVVAWAVIWAVIALAFPIITLVVRRHAPQLVSIRTTVSAALLLVAAVIFCQSIATYPISESFFDTLGQGDFVNPLPGVLVGLAAQLSYLVGILLVLPPRREYPSATTLQTA